MRKKRIGILSNCPVGGKTGLGRNMLAIVPEFYRSGKYEVFFLAQGMSDNSVEFQKLPFKVEGVFRNFDQNRFNQDEGYRRIVAYGCFALEEFVLKNEIDCLVLSDDIWAFPNELTINTDWFKHMSKNVLPVITADSVPLLPQIKEWAEKCPNMRFWSKFAKRVLLEENPDKYKHCDVIYGALNTDDFKPLPSQERLEIRRKFGIKDDEKIIMYLGRNQLRKIYGSHIEGLAQFRRKYPDKKVRLFFHCSWAEQGGWPLNQMRKQNGLKPEDILTTYYCRNCQDWNIQPYEGEELNCPHCRAEKSRFTAGIGSTITEKELNQIYNIADGSASIFTSGSFEFTNPESMLAGVPLAVPSYVCGEDFLESGSVYEIKGTLTWEHQTGFKKFVPSIDSVCDFFNYIHDLPDEKRSEIITKSRDWAVAQFNTKSISKLYMDFFDSCQPIDWNNFREKKKEIKNINAPVQDFPDDIQFIKNAYKTILNMDVDDDDSGLLHWSGFLKQQNRDKGQLKNELVSAMRNAGNIHNQKVNPTTLESLLDVNDKSRVLLVLKESYGDHFMLTSLLPEIQAKYPDSTIYIGSEPKYWEIYDGCPTKLKFIPWTPELDSELAMAGQGGNKGMFNYYVNVGIATQKLLNYLSNTY
jgi:glycosyltransferase involved in cell wall biosynthesis